MLNPAVSCFRLVVTVRKMTYYQTGLPRSPRQGHLFAWRAIWNLGGLLSHLLTLITGTAWYLKTWVPPALWWVLLMLHCNLHYCLFFTHYMFKLVFAFYPTGSPNVFYTYKPEYWQVGTETCFSLAALYFLYALWCQIHLFNGSTAAAVLFSPAWPICPVAFCLMSARLLVGRD